MRENIKKSVKYHVHILCKIALCYYGVILVMQIVNIGVAHAIHSKQSLVLSINTVSYLDIASIIFLFTLGIISFRMSFAILIQNGLSRRAIYYGQLLVFIAISLSMSLLDHLLRFVLDSVSSSMGLFRFKTMYELVYGLDRNVNLLKGLMITFAMYLFVSPGINWDTMDVQDEMVLEYYRAALVGVRQTNIWMVLIGFIMAILIFSVFNMLLIRKAEITGSHLSEQNYLR